ncbi:MAG: RNA pseudouridine synthase, partial [Candidatus Kerfeldbacteria bacterium]|nr:RNA pseudouridine synthase [Candidatus Kerfeldbacteria bacterium]
VGVGENATRPGIVHRLDRDVSGVMVVAKTQEAFAHLKAQFANRTVRKEYLALVHGVMQQPDGEIRFSIDRSVRDGKIAAKSDQSGKDAITKFWVEQRFQQYTLLKVQILTGRTNQIRVHLRARSHPIVGDTRYGRGRPSEPISRPFLHSSHLAFLNMAGEQQSFTAPLPADLEAFLVGIHSPHRDG